MIDRNAFIFDEFPNDQNLLCISFKHLGKNNPFYFSMEISCKNHQYSHSLMEDLIDLKGINELEGKNYQNFKLSHHKIRADLKITGNIYNALFLLKTYGLISAELCNNIFSRKEVESFLIKSKEVILPENKHRIKESISNIDEGISLSEKTDKEELLVTEISSYGEDMKDKNIVRNNVFEEVRRNQIIESSNEEKKSYKSRLSPKTQIVYENFKSLLDSEEVSIEEKNTLIEELQNLLSNKGIVLIK